MKRLLKINITSQVLFCLIIFGCANSKKTYFKNETVKSCDLSLRLSDTIVVTGIYSKCMEYNSFYLKKSDKCKDLYNMDLRFSKNSNYADFKVDFQKLIGCNQYVELTLKGIVRKQKKQYGHLGTNNAEFEVLEILAFGKVKH